MTEGMNRSVYLLVAERERKIALRDSYQRQLDALSKRRESTQIDLKRIENDIAKLYPPAPVLEEERERLRADGFQYEEEQSHIRSEIKYLDDEIRTLAMQIRQLGGTLSLTSTQ